MKGQRPSVGLSLFWPITAASADVAPRVATCAAVPYAQAAMTIEPTTLRPAAQPAPRRAPGIIISGGNSDDINNAARDWLKNGGHDWMSTEAGFVQAFIRQKDGAPFRLEPYQINVMNWAYPDGRLPTHRAILKSRQVGMSFTFALEALARCHLRNGYKAIIISYNEAEAKSKIDIIRSFYDELPARFRKKLMTNTKTALSFASPSGRAIESSEVVCLPCKSSRGHRGDLLLDETAIYKNDLEVYKGSIPSTTHGNPRPQTTMSSTPLGKRGIHYDVISRSTKPYAMYKRYYIPWWVSRFLCVDVKQAFKLAPHMATQERVEMFGNESLKNFFDSMVIEDFQQEFECAYVDDSTSFFPYDLILGCTDPSLLAATDTSDVGPVRGRLVAGVDIGRVRDYTAISVFDETRDGGSSRFRCVFIAQLEKASFDRQEATIRGVLNELPIVRMSIDQGGIGRDLTERLSTSFPGVVVPENFTSESKERWATNFKILMQQGRLVLPANREVVSTIHSIRKSVTASARPVFDADRSRGTGHADLFWAMALACQKEQQTQKPIVGGDVLVIG